MIIDAHTHMVNSRYFDQLIDKGGKWGKEGVDWVVERAQRKLDMFSNKKEVYKYAD